MSNFTSIYFMANLKKILPFITNRYFLVVLGFAIWMLFFDQRDYFQQKERATELNKLEAAKKYYQDEISKTKKQLENLQNNPAAIEKFARERYLLKRDGEEVYLFEDSMPSGEKK
ncbi:MAG: septum formation initiator family protein [Chitinophagia bacterium]